MKVLADAGYRGMPKIHKNALLPHKKLSKDKKAENKALSSQRVVVENGLLKRFKIIADRYRSRRKRFGLRFNLIASIYNFGERSTNCVK